MASLLYACEVIEQFDREEVVDVLTGWVRVLSPGGVLQLSVPNFAVIAKLYQAGFKRIGFWGHFMARSITGMVDTFFIERLAY